MAKVRLSSAGYGYILEVLDAALLDNILRVVRDNGGPNNETAYFAPENLYNDGDLYPGITPETYEAVSRGWTEEFEMDDWYIAAAFGYSAHDELMMQGVI